GGRHQAGADGFVKPWAEGGGEVDPAARGEPRPEGPPTPPAIDDAEGGEREGRQGGREEGVRPEGRRGTEGGEADPAGGDEGEQPPEGKTELHGGGPRGPRGSTGSILTPGRDHAQRRSREQGVQACEASPLPGG